MAEDEEQERPRWARWVTYGSLVMALAALVWTIYAVGLSEIFYRLSLIGPWFAVVIGIEVLVTACDAAAIHAFLRPDHRKIGYRRVIMAQVAGRAVNAVTPMGSLGEVVKISMIVEHVPQSRALAAVLLYNITGIEISLVLISFGAPLTALFLDMTGPLATTLFVAGGVCAALAIGLPILVFRGMLSSIVGLGRKLHLVSKKQERRWRSKVESVDDKLRDAKGARRNDRILGIAFLAMSRALNWTITGVLVHASGGPVSIGFLAAVFTAGQVITWAAGMVPLGLGISETGNYGLFRGLGVAPAIGVTVALGRRVNTIIYAAIGLVLVSVNQTVKAAKAAKRKARKPQRAAAPAAVAADRPSAGRSA